MGFIALFLAAGASAACAGSSTGYAASVTVAIIGDCLPGHHYNRLIEKGLDPFRDLRPLLSSADMAVANLECPLTSKGKAVSGKRFIFRAPPAHAELLAGAGLDVLGLANNHIMDYGAEGLQETISSLAGAGLRWCGAGANAVEARRPASVVAGGVRIAVLAYNRTLPKNYWAQGLQPGTAFASEEQVRADVKQACSNHDAVVVMLHGGREKTYEIRAYQSLVARAAIESGAALVVGSHPHVAQGVQRIGDGVAAYSLGDALFGGAWNRKEDGLLLRAFFIGGRLSAIELLAINVGIAATGGVPAVRGDESASEVLGHVKALSLDLGTELYFAKSDEGLPCVRLELASGGIAEAGE